MTMVVVLNVLTGVFYLLISLILSLLAYTVWKQGYRAGFALVLFLTILWYIYLGLLIGTVIG